MRGLPLDKETPVDQLKQALARALGAPEAPAAPEAAAAPAAPPAAPALPDPLAGAWGELLRRERVEIPRAATLGQLTQRSDARARELKAAGRPREARALVEAKEAYLREREKAAWSLVKDRFEALGLPEKSYRALKQEGALPEKVLEKLAGARGDALRGAGHARVRDALLG